MLDFLKTDVRLGSPLMVVVMLAALTIWLYVRPPSKAARRGVLLLCLGYWIFSAPLGAYLLTAGLSRGVTPIESAAAAQGADLVVVLGGGANTYSAGGEVIGQLTPGSAFRVLEGVRLYRLLGPTRVIVSAGQPRPDLVLRAESQVMRGALLRLGVPEDRIEEESASKTTHDQAVLLAPGLIARGARRFVLVTSPAHMARALAVFRAAGLDPVPSAAAVQSEGVAQPPWLMPNETSQALSNSAIYEYAALVYYWWSGWLSARHAGSL
jgi:uncharacterized SAM-binding protein YcdF (DUF218 family)